MKRDRVETEPEWADQLKEMNSELEAEDITLVNADGLTGPVVRSAPAGMHQHEPEHPGDDLLIHEHEGGLTAHPHYDGQVLAYPVNGYSIPSGLGTGVESDVTTHQPARGGWLAEPVKREFYDREEVRWEELELWIRKHQDDIRAGAVAKARVYGEKDFDLMAAISEVIAPGDGPGSNKMRRIEGELVRYVGGKLGRIASALARGETPDPDSWRDIEVYAIIAQKYGETGSWTG